MQLSKNERTPLAMIFHKPNEEKAKVVSFFIDTDDDTEFANISKSVKQEIITIFQSSIKNVKLKFEIYIRDTGKIYQVNPDGNKAFIIKGEHGRDVDRKITLTPGAMYSCRKSFIEEVLKSFQ